MSNLYNPPFNGLGTYPFSIPGLPNYIQGPAGPTGADSMVTGPTGLDGPTGPTGPTLTPAGTDGQLQYNNNGAFGASTITSDGGVVLNGANGSSIVLGDSNKRTVLSGITSDDGPVIIQSNVVVLIGDDELGNLRTGNLTVNTGLNLPNNCFLADNGSSIGTANQVLTAGPAGAKVRWADPPAPTPAGTDGQLQYNNAGVLGGSTLQVSGSAISSGVLAGNAFLNMKYTDGTVPGCVTIDTRNNPGGAIVFNSNIVGVFADYLRPLTLSFQPSTGYSFSGPGVHIEDYNGSSGQPGQVLTAVDNAPYPPAPTWSWGTVPSGTSIINTAGFTTYWIPVCANDANSFITTTNAPVTVTLQIPDGTTQNWIVVAKPYLSSSNNWYIQVEFSTNIINTGTIMSWAVNAPDSTPSPALTTAP